MSQLAIEIYQLFEEFEEAQREESLIQVAVYRERKCAANRARTRELNWGRRTARTSRRRQTAIRRQIRVAPGMCKNRQGERQ